MKYKIQETIFGTFRVLWKHNDGIRGGHQDFQSRSNAYAFVDKLKSEYLKPTI
tara:strand:+ start:403 stop:561 length:159 start_codon:yes stop_codon:yes gene_type:complete